MMRKIERENTGLLQAGQDLVVAGYAGLAGTVKLAEAAKEELSRWFSDEYMEEIADAAPLCPVSPEFWRSCGAAEWEPAGEGGILTAIWNLTGAYETGVEFYLRQIPMRQETVEVCERLEFKSLPALQPGMRAPHSRQRRAACTYTGRKTYSGPGYRPGEQRHCTGNDRAGGAGLSGAPAAR